MTFLRFCPFQRALKLQFLKQLFRFSILLVLLSPLALVSAQTYTGRILGTVRDQSQASIAGAKVTVTDVERGTVRTIVTDEAGEYVVPDLVPGKYSVRGEANGFKSFERKGLQLEVAKDIRVDLELTAGDNTEVVVVTSEIPMLDSTTSTLGGTLSNQTINDLPLNGRNYQNLLQLQPGIMNYPGGGTSTHSSNGIRPEDNVYLVDGMENVEPFNGGSIINGNALAGDAATVLPIDAIQEFNVEVNPPAEYGWKPGAVVNVGLKSGTNELHGTAYAFGRDTALDARNFYNPAGSPQTPVALEQFGATAGGVIIKNKLFYFGGYEGQRYTVGNSYSVAVPETTAQTTPDSANSLPNAIAALQTAGIPVSPVSLKLAGCTAGTSIACTGGVFGANNGTSPNLSVGFPNEVTGNNGLVKIDYHLNDNNTISGMYFFGDSNGTLADKQYVQPQYLTLLHTRAQVADGHWTWTPNSSWVNEAHFGYSRMYQPVFPGDQNVLASTYGLDTGVTNPLLGGLPSISISGFTALGNGANHPKIIGPDESFDFIDNVSRLYGKHAIKFGGEVRKYLVDQGTFRSARGTIKFSKNSAFHGATPLEDFFAGLPSQGSIQVGDPTRHLSQWSYAGFVQDDWRIRPRITLNLGLRYEFSTPPSDSQDLLGNFDPTLGLVQVGQQIGSIYKPDYRNFSPRLGIAWDVTGDGTTIVRAGGSIIYDTLSMDVLISQQQTSNAPTLGLGVIPTGALINGVPGTGTIDASSVTLPGSQLNWNGTVFANATTVTCSNGSPCSILGMDQNFRTPYVSTWTLNVQHSFGGNLSAEVAYVGNHGTKLPGIVDINQATPGSGWTPAAIATGAPDTTAEQASRPFNSAFPYLGFINYIKGIYSSNYNGLQATLRGKNYHGVSFLAAYTYSHALDYSSENWNQYTPQDSTNPAGQYGNSDWDIRHRFTLSMTYEIPGKKMRGQLLEGWQLNSIISLQSGAPWTTADTVDDISGTGEFADRWDFFGNASDFTSGPNPIPYFSGTSNPGCVARATTPGMLASLTSFGCYQKGNSYLLPPALGTFGTAGRNIFRDSGYRNWDLSVVKAFKFRERLTAQFRAELFNVLNHPNIANPYGGPSDYGAGANDDPSSHNLFGCGCATPDVAAANPVLGSGGNRAIQLGLKLLF